MIPSDEVPQFSLFDQILNLLFQIVTFIRVMPMVPESDNIYSYCAYWDLPSSSLAILEKGRL